MNLINVVQTCPCYMRNPEYGGPVVSAFELALALHSQGIKVKIVASWFRPIGGRWFAPTVFESRVEADVVYMGHIGSYRMSAVDLGGWGQVVRWLLNCDVVLVHGYRNFVGTCATLLAFAFGKRVVWLPHGMVSKRNGASLHKRLFDVILGRILVAASEYVVCHSKREIEEFRTTFPNVKNIVECPPPPPRRDPSACGERFKERNGLVGKRIVLFIGRISPVKNLVSLIDAFATMIYDDLVLVLAGPNEDQMYFTELEGRILERNVTSRCKLVGPLYGLDKHDALAAANVFVLPSLYESFGRAAWEALAYAVPVVVSEECGVYPLLPSALRFMSGVDSKSIAIVLQQALASCVSPKWEVDEDLSSDVPELVHLIRR